MAGVESRDLDLFIFLDGLGESTDGLLPEAAHGMPDTLTRRDRPHARNRDFMPGEEIGSTLQCATDPDWRASTAGLPQPRVGMTQTTRRKRKKRLISPRRKELNRRSAKNSRDRQKAYLQQLEATNADLACREWGLFSP